MPSRSEEWEASLDLTMDKHKLREYRRLLQTSLCFAAISLLSVLEAFYQNLTRQVVSHPPWWLAWVIFGVNSLVFFMFAIARFMSAQSLGSSSSWEDDIMLGSRRGALFRNRGSVGRDEMTTPEVSGSTSTSYRDSLKSRSVARNGTTPQRLRIVGDGREPTPGYKMPDRMTPFSSVDISGNFMAPMRRLTPSEVDEISRRSLSIRPQDVGNFMKEFKERYAKAEPAPQQETSSPSQMPLSSLSYTAPQSPMRGYYSYQRDADISTIRYQVYIPDEMTSRWKGEGPECRNAKQLLLRLGISRFMADGVTRNVKFYVVCLMRKFLRQFDEVCSLLHARGVAKELLLQQLHRQPQVQLKNIPRVFFNLSLKDMDAQFGHLGDFWVVGPDGNPMNLFHKYQLCNLQEALQVTAGSGVVGDGNPAYVLERLREWETDRPFARQHFLDRQPLTSDALPGRYFLTRNEALRPPYYFVVANQEVWNAMPGHSNVFQAIALFFLSIKKNKSGYLTCGIDVNAIIQGMFS